MADKEPSRNDGPRKCSDKDNHNPFIAFRRFADEQVSSLLGLVGSISNDIAKTAQERRQEVIDQMERRARDTDRTQSSKEEASSDVLSAMDRMVADMEKELDNAFSNWEKRVEASRQRSEEWRKEQEDNQMQENEWEETTHRNENGNTWHTSRWADSREGRAVQGMTSTKEATMSTGGEVSTQLRGPFGDSPLIQPSFFLFSEYSPLILEQQHDPPFPWRDAFEDLLNAERRQPMEERGVLGRHNSEAPADWIYGLWRRTRHPGLGRYCLSPSSTLQSLLMASESFERDVGEAFDPLKIFSRIPVWKSRGSWGETEDHVSRRIQDQYEEADEEDENDEDEEEEDDEDEEEEGDNEEDVGSLTEQDLYERHFGIFGPPDTVCKEPRHADEKKPSILSTLTTTERTIHPDGSVTTKVVLRKRFSNGKEENSETVHNSIDGSEPKLDSLVTEPSQVARSSKQDTEISGKEPKRGWFWSS